MLKIDPLLSRHHFPPANSLKFHGSRSISKLHCARKSKLAKLSLDVAMLLRLLLPKAFVDFCGKKHSAAGADTAKAVRRNLVPVEIVIV